MRPICDAWDQIGVRHKEGMYLTNCSISVVDPRQNILTYSTESFLNGFFL